MRFDKWTLVSGAVALVLTVVLGALAGALAGVLTALSGALEGSPAGYLRAGERVVPFWPRPEFEDLRDWLAADIRSGVRLVTGEAGSGKTRLAIELARAAADFGYRCYWVSKDGE